MDKYFYYNERLGIDVPVIKEDWDSLTTDIQQSILLHWEKIRGKIPDRIKDLEKIINTKQSQLSNESNFDRSCQLNREIADLASTINDLWLWFRTDQDISEKVHM
ncbi:hypothetical protein R4Z10_04925 [Niallia sp. XMNu-256]|uniref:hypothetical protein n=1 Tax=Niallia sp. XMNu-256 TaxID=3082444 RepID=UPI0030CC7D7B